MYAKMELDAKTKAGGGFSGDSSEGLLSTVDMLDRDESQSDSTTMINPVFPQVNGMPGMMPGMMMPGMCQE